MVDFLDPDSFFSPSINNPRRLYNITPITLPRLGALIGFMEDLKAPQEFKTNNDKD